MIKKKKKAKKTKYRKFAFKLSTKEIQLIEMCSKQNKSTPNKIIKKAIREFLKRNLNKTATEQSPVSENQMDIFDIIGEG